jgi:uncharacterized protein (TIGR01777 family)
MRVLMTGGTGLLGSCLSRTLLEQGHQLTVLSRHPESVKIKCGNEVNFFTTLEQWAPALTFDIVINLAGEPIADKHWSARQKKLLWDSRVTLTEQLVRKIAAAKEKPAVLLSGSAVGYYGNRGSEALTEASAMGEGFSAQLCGAWEEAAKQAEQFGVRVCLLRTGLVLSKQGGLLSRMRLPLGFGVRFGDGNQWMSWIHIDDYINCLMLLLNDSKANGAFNMTSPKPVTNGEFSRALVEVQQGPVVLPVPVALLKLMLQERATLLLEGQRVLPKKIDSLGYLFIYPELSNALHSLIKN